MKSCNRSNTMYTMLKIRHFNIPMSSDQFFVNNKITKFIQNAEFKGLTNITGREENVPARKLLLKQYQWNP